jgi:hypothetical protein
MTLFEQNIIDVVLNLKMFTLRRTIILKSLGVSHAAIARSYHYDVSTIRRRLKQAEKLFNSLHVSSEDAYKVLHRHRDYIAQYNVENPKWFYTNEHYGDYKHPNWREYFGDGI